MLSVFNNRYFANKSKQEQYEWKVKSCLPAQSYLIKSTVHLSCAHQHPERSHVHVNLNMIFCAHVEHGGGDSSVVRAPDS